MRNCTDLFFRYREISRLVWNLGIWPNPILADWDCVELYREAMSRLFDAMILVPLGCEERVKDKYYPGKTARFSVEINSQEAELQVNKNLPSEPGGIWGKPTLRAKRGEQQLRFMSFFDWEQRGPRDLQLIEVLIERFDSRPDCVGHHGLISLDRCSILLIDEPDREPVAPAV